MKFESKQATCKPRKENVMEESICQRTTMQRVQGRKLTIFWIRFRQKQIIDHQALQIYSLKIKIHSPMANVQNSTAATMGNPEERN